MRIVLSLILAFCTVVPSRADTPNILLVIADDMGRDATHCYEVGSQQAPMPHLEALCDSGLVFDNAYAMPVCSPTRAAIMTGKYGFATGVRGAVPRRGDTGGLSGDEVSLFDVLTPTGYASAIIGKWHLATASDGLNHPASLGVQDYFGLYSGGVRDYFNWQAVDNGRRVDIEGYATTVLADRAIDWIADQGEAPWFLWLAFNAPHAPFQAPPSHLHSFDLEPGAEAPRGQRLPTYQAMLEAMDTELGRVLDSMDAATRANTVVIFIGDNGSPNQVARDLYAPHGAKGSVTEGGAHVPMIVNGPGIPDGRTDAFASVIDLFQTIASLAGAAAESQHGHDLTPVFKGNPSPRDTVFVEHVPLAGNRGNADPAWSLRQGSFKLVTKGDEQSLFDLSKDPMENRDLLSDGISTEESRRLDVLGAAYRELIETR